MSVLGHSVVRIFGQYFSFYRVGYEGAAVSFNTDQSATNAAVVVPSSGGPTVSIAAASTTGNEVSGVSGLDTVTLAAGGSSQGGVVIVVVNHGKSVAGHHPS